MSERKPCTKRNYHSPSSSHSTSFSALLTKAHSSCVEAAISLRSYHRPFDRTSYVVQLRSTLLYFASAKFVTTFSPCLRSRKFVAHWPTAYSPISFLLPCGICIIFLVTLTILPTIASSWIRIWPLPCANQLNGYGVTGSFGLHAFLIFFENNESTDYPAHLRHQMKKKNTACLVHFPFANHGHP